MVALARDGLVPVRKTIVRRGKSIEVTYWVNPQRRKRAAPGGESDGGDGGEGERAEDRAAKLVTDTKTITTKSGKTYQTTVQIDPKTYAARAARRAAWKAKKAAHQGQPPAAPPAKSPPPAAAAPVAAPPTGAGPGAKPHLVSVTKTITTKSGKTYTTTVQIDPKTYAARAARRAAWKAKQAAKKGAEPPKPAPSKPAKPRPPKAPAKPPPPTPAATTGKVLRGPELPTRQSPAWVTQTSTPEGFIRMNRTQLEQLTIGVQELTGMGVGANDFRVNRSRDAYGSYDRYGRTIFLSQERAGALATAVTTGRVDTELQLAAIKTTMHEMFHAASNPSYQYDAYNGGKQMEEGTTEYLAQHFHQQFAERRMGLKVAGSVTKGDLLRPQQGAADPLESTPGVPVITRPTSYPNEVKAFTRIVAFADGLDTDSMSSEELSGHIAKRALEVKRSSDDGGPSGERFNIFVRPVMERNKIEPDHPRFRQISESLNKLMRTFMEGSGNISKAGWDRNVDQIINQGGMK
jgi:hypothetical protein